MTAPNGHCSVSILSRARERFTGTDNAQEFGRKPLDLCVRERDCRRRTLKEPAAHEHVRKALLPLEKVAVDWPPGWSTRLPLGDPMRHASRSIAGVGDDLQRTGDDNNAAVAATEGSRHEQQHGQ